MIGHLNFNFFCNFTVQVLIYKKYFIAIVQKPPVSWSVFKRSTDHTPGNETQMGGENITKLRSKCSDVYFSFLMENQQIVGFRISIPFCDFIHYKQKIWNSFKYILLTNQAANFTKEFFNFASEIHNLSDCYFLWFRTEIFFNQFWLRKFFCSL